MKVVPNQTIIIFEENRNLFGFLDKRMREKKRKRNGKRKRRREKRENLKTLEDTLPLVCSEPVHLKRSTGAKWEQEKFEKTSTEGERETYFLI